MHCGFCNATCPTYQLLGDELDGPRGRIYLMKSVLEGNPVTRHTQQHLDRCLTCQACETTCPSGVEYHRLLDIGRKIVDERVGRPWHQRAVMRMLRAVLPHSARFGTLIRFAQTFRAVMPRALKALIPPRQPVQHLPQRRLDRRMLFLDGCVQPTLAPNINAAAARVLGSRGIQLTKAPNEVCCGALSFHLNAQEEGLSFARRNVDAWWPFVKDGVEAIVTTASGCGAFIKEYGRLLEADRQYAEKALRIQSLTKDISEVLAAGDLNEMKLRRTRKLAFHSPCTLQHAQSLVTTTQDVLSALGFELTQVPNAHLCCGSAGTYSLLQPKLARQLRDGKVAALESGAPDEIVSANIGCISHLGAAANVRVRHWIEIVDEAMR